MLNLDQVIEQYAKGNSVNLPVLLYFAFEDQPMWIWGGGYDIPDPNGQVWQGCGKAGRLITVEGLETANTLEAKQIKVTLSGADAQLMGIMANVNRGDYVGQLLIVYNMFCDANWQPISAPIAVGAGIMGTATVDRQREKDGWLRQITLPADNIMYGRGGAPFSFYTDRDQALRWPGSGDTGLQYVATLQDTSIPIPWH
jgi:hypothetical protein